MDVEDFDLSGVEQLYQDSKKTFDADPQFADRARRRVVKLQGGDAETLRIWRTLIDISLEGFNATYARLSVLLTDEDVAGESSYNDDLPRVVDGSWLTAWPSRTTAHCAFSSRGRMPQ